MILNWFCSWLGRGAAMSYSDYEGDSDVEVEVEGEEKKEDEVVKKMVTFCKYG